MPAGQDILGYCYQEQNLPMRRANGKTTAKKMGKDFGYIRK